MSRQIRRTLLTCAATSLALLALQAPGSAQPARGPQPAIAAADPYGGFDDDRLYQDQNGALYRRRGGQYVPYSGRVQYGRPVAEPAAPATAPAADPDAEAYARRRAALPGEPPPAGAGAAGSGPANSDAGTVARQPGYSVPDIKPDDGPIDHAKAYSVPEKEPFPVQAFNWKKANPAFLRQEVAFNTAEPPGTIVVDPKAHFLYLVLPNGRARRYGVGVGKQGFSWSGASTINSKQAWPDWYPPKEMIARKPELARQVSTLQSGVGVPGGSGNPLGARAMYLWQNNKDTLFRIHGTTEPQSIGHSVSSGCIRMINQDAIDLFSRVGVGTKVVVLG